MNKNNIVNITGVMCSQFTYDHTTLREEFYMGYIATGRSNGAYDILPVMISARMVDVTADWLNVRIKITGNMRSFDEHIEGRVGRRLKLYIWVDSFEETVECDTNQIELTGYLCRQPNLRIVLSDRKISEAMLAVSRSMAGKQDYIPVIAWHRNAEYLSGFNLKANVYGKGRIQSREYQKYADGATETRVAYEVSLSELDELPYIS